MSVKRYEFEDYGTNEDDGRYVTYEDYAALEAKCAALAAENAGLIEQSEEVYAAGYNHGHLNTVDGIAHADCVKDDFYGLAVELMREAETTAADAFLAEMRAQGVESAINMVVAMMNHQHPVAEKVIDILNTHAAQLRKGVQS